MQDTQVRSLDQEESLEKEMATHSTILACRIPWTEEPGGLQSTGSQKVRKNWATNNFKDLRDAMTVIMKKKKKTANADTE